MASTVSGQDESNPMLWLATWAGKMELSCLLGITHRVLQEKFPESHTGYWPRSFFCEFMDPTLSWSINTQIKELGQYPAILTSHLVNNPYFNDIPPHEPTWAHMSLHCCASYNVHVVLVQHQKIRIWPTGNKFKANIPIALLFKRNIPWAFPSFSIDR